MKRTTLAALAVMPLLASCSSSPQTPAASDVIGRSVQTCSLSSNPAVKVGDGGATLTVDGFSEDTRIGLRSAGMGCLVAALGISDAVLSQMNDTRALDGRQEGAWTTGDGAQLRASWTYSPGDGLDFIVTGA